MKMKVMRKISAIIFDILTLFWCGVFLENIIYSVTRVSTDKGSVGILGGAVCRVVAPLGFGSIKATLACILGLVAKEEVVGVFGVLDFEGMTRLAAYSFLVFNLLCAPCFAAIGAIKREMNSAKWTWFAIGYQCAFAYASSLMIYQFGSAFVGNLNPIGLAAALIMLVFILYMLFKPYRKSEKSAIKLRGRNNAYVDL